MATLPDMMFDKNNISVIISQLAAILAIVTEIHLKNCFSVCFLQFFPLYNR